jgi:hypothetical protein
MKHAEPNEDFVGGGVKRKHCRREAAELIFTGGAAAPEGQKRPPRRVSPVTSAVAVAS